MSPRPKSNEQASLSVDPRTSRPSVCAVRFKRTDVHVRGDVLAADCGEWITPDDMVAIGDQRAIHA